MGSFKNHPLVWDSQAARRFSSPHTGKSGVPVAIPMINEVLRVRNFHMGGPNQALAGYLGLSRA